MNTKQRKRARFVLILMAAGACVLLARLFDTDIIHGRTYAARAEAQYSKPAADSFDRGTIYFSSRDGTETAAAVVENGYLVYMDPLLVTDPGGEYQAVSQFLNVDKASFMAKAAKAAFGDPYEVLADKVSTTTGEEVSGLDLPGIRTVPESWRSYPGGSLAAHELGVVAEDASSSEVSGRYGLENYYNDILSRPPSAAGIDTIARLFSGIESTVLSGDHKKGDIVTTIDPTLEAYLEKVLTETQDKWHPNEIGGIVMDPQSGAILAMASHPTFDPNDLTSLSSSAVLTDPMVQDVYEMGSIVKPLTMAAALDSGTVTPDSTYDDTGCMMIQGNKVCNFDFRPRGPKTPMQQILSQSLNVGAATIAMEMGSTTFTRYFTDFGMRDKSGIDLPNEATPITDNLNIGEDIDIATAAFGQGIAVSPVQMARALSAIANGGYLVTPHLVKEIDYDDGKTMTPQWAKTGPFLRPETAKEMDDMLTNVVDHGFLPYTISRAHYSQAAKTGTAQIADPQGGYYANKYLHSFFGYFPAYDARFLVFLYQVDPKGGPDAEYASKTLTQPYDDMVDFLINYYDVPPDRDLKGSQGWFTMPNS